MFLYVIALGVVQLDLSSFAADVVSGEYQHPTQHRFPLAKSFIQGAYLDCTISPQLMSTDSSGGDQDDTMSMQSGFSDAPVMSADFDMGSLPQYSAAEVTTREKVPEEEEGEEEEEEDNEEEEALALALHKKSLEFDGLVHDHEQLGAGYAQCQEALADAQRALEQLRVQSERQLEDSVRESEAAAAARLTHSRITAAARSSSPSGSEAIATLRTEMAAMFEEELGARTRLQAALSQALQVKAARLAEAETRGLHLLEKVNLLEARNSAMQAALLNTLPRLEYEDKLRRREDEFRRQIMDLRSTKDHAESELEREIERNHDLKRRLQLYSESVAGLEVHGAAAIPRPSPASPSSPAKRTAERRSSCGESPGDGDQEVLFEGELTKRGSFYPSWKKRHFVLHGDSHLSYFTNQDDMVFKGHFVISKDTVLGKTSLSGYDCFYLEHAKRRLYMTASSPGEEEQWVAVFRRSIAALNSRSE